MRALKDRPATADRMPVNERTIDNRQGAPDGGGSALSEAVRSSVGRWAERGFFDIESELAQLEVQHGEAVYSDLIFTLAHLNFPPDEAKQCWREICEVRDAMQRGMGTPVDLRVAMANYFIGVNKRLHSPVIVELRIFEQTKAFAYRDALTGLYNHRFFMETLEQEVERARRLTVPLSLVIADVDHFKRFNDQYGHLTGDKVLATIARILDQSVRGSDLTARYGGEEFAILLPGTPKSGAVPVAERARSRIEAHDLKDHAGETLTMTVSMGIATFPGDAKRSKDLLRCADRALYVAKASGRNQVQLHAQTIRSYKRVDTCLSGRFGVADDHSSRLKTLNLSEGGACFETDRELPADTLLDLRLDLPEGRGEIASAVRVVYTRPHGGGRFETAVRIVNIEGAHRLQLNRYLDELRGDLMPGSAASPIR